MSLFSFKKLSPLAFTKATAKRDEIIANASDKPLAPTDSYKANQIANALHPKSQYLKVSKVVQHSPYAKTFYLVPDEEKGTKKLAYFSAGQYLSISLTIGESELTRPYSLSSSPKESTEGFYMLTIKRVDGGLVSQYILDNWDVGTQVTASEPLGFFTYEPLRDAKTIIGIAGGSGITPFRSLARAIADGDEDADLVLIYGSRTLDDALFEDEFLLLEKSCPKFKIINVLSDEQKDGFESGFITAELIEKYKGEGEFSIFMCGPQAMYNFVDKEVEKLNLKRKFVRHELFGEFFNPQNEDDYPSSVESEYSITVSFGDDKKTIKASSNTSILRSLESAGIKAPAHCRSGECGWCHSRLISGNVYTPESVDGRREADLIYGYIHPCCAFPLSDIEIEINPDK